MIQTLSSDKWPLWRELRLQALKKSPQNFGGSFEEESMKSDEDFQKDLEKSRIFGAFHEGQLVGCAGFSQQNLLKMQHRGTLFSFYVSPEFRRYGIGDLLLKAVIQNAQRKVIQLHCSVITNNPAAISLYKKNGFEIYGTEPRALKVEDTFYDDYLMVLKLR